MNKDVVQLFVLDKIGHRGVDGEARLGRTLREAPKGSGRGGATPERGSSERRRLGALALIHGGRRGGCTAEFEAGFRTAGSPQPLLVCAGWRRVSAVSVPPEMCYRAQVVAAPCWRGLWMPTCFRFHSSSLPCLLARGLSPLLEASSPVGMAARFKSVPSRGCKFVHAAPRFLSVRPAPCCWLALASI